MPTFRRKAEANRVSLKRLFDARLKSFQVDAVNIRRGFEVSMAVNVFGVGTLLPNELPH